MINPNHAEHGMFPRVAAAVLNTCVIAILLGGEPVLGISEDGDVLFAIGF